MKDIFSVFQQLNEKISVTCFKVRNRKFNKKYTNQILIMVFKNKKTKFALYIKVKIITKICKVFVSFSFV